MLLVDWVIAVIWIFDPKFLNWEKTNHVIFIFQYNADIDVGFGVYDQLSITPKRALTAVIVQQTRNKGYSLQPTIPRYLFWSRSTEHKMYIVNFGRLRAPYLHSLWAPNTLIRACWSTMYGQLPSLYVIWVLNKYYICNA